MVAVETKNVFDLLLNLKILLQMNLLQKLLGKGLFRATCIPKTFRGSQAASKQRLFCYILELCSYVHSMVAYTELKLLCSCTALRSLGHVCLASVGAMIRVSSLTTRH